MLPSFQCLKNNSTHKSMMICGGGIDIELSWVDQTSAVTPEGPCTIARDCRQSDGPLGGHEAPNGCLIGLIFHWQQGDCIIISIEDVPNSGKKTE